MMSLAKVLILFNIIVASLGLLELVAALVDSSININETTYVITDCGDVEKLDDQINNRFKRDNAQNLHIRVLTFNVKNYASPKEAFNPTTKSDKERVAKGMAIAKVILDRDIDLVALQELRDADAAMTIAKYMNDLQVKRVYTSIANGPLPPTGRSKEWYGFIYRSDILIVRRSHSPSPLRFGNFIQPRPPFIVEFRLQYSSGANGFIDITIGTIHTRPDSSSTHTTRDEIDAFYDTLAKLVNQPFCYSANVIALGDFNQSPRYVLTNWLSKFERNSLIHELSYTGSSSNTVKDPLKDNRLDRSIKFSRIYLSNPVFSALVLFQNGDTVFVNRNSPHFVYNNKKVSDHYSLDFTLSMTKLGKTYKTKQCLTTG